MGTTVVLTKRIIDAAEPRAQEYHLWDAKLRGLALRVHPSGTKTFILKKRTVHGRQIKVTVGRFGQLTIEEARNFATNLTTDLIRGSDPARARREARQMPRFDVFARRYLAEHCEVKNKPSSLRNNRDLIEKVLIPRFGAKPISEIVHDDIVKLRNAQRTTPYRANRTVALMRHMMNWAEELEFRPRHSNPCPKGIMLPERARNRFLSDDEVGRLAQALNDEEAIWRPLLPHSACQLSLVFAIRLLVLTGCRLSEILSLKWDDVDLAHRLIVLKDSKTGPKPIYLSDEAIAVLNTIPKIDGNPHVITGRKKGAHLVNLEKPWRRLRTAANLPGVRIHDLRHTYASYGVASGLGLPLVGALLGHSNASTTQRYAHIGASPARVAAEQVGQSIGAVFQAPAQRRGAAE